MYTKDEFMSDMTWLEDLNIKREKFYAYLGDNEVTETLDDCYDKISDSIVYKFKVNNEIDVEDSLYNWLYKDFYNDEFLSTIKDYSKLYDYLLTKTK